MKVVITHCYSDSNKGDLAIVLATVQALQRLFPGTTITLQSVYPEEDLDFAFHFRFIRRTGARVEEGILPSPYVDTAAHGVTRNLKALARLVRSYLGLRLWRYLPGITRTLNKKQSQAIRTIEDADLIIAKGGQYIYNDQGGMRGHLYLQRMLETIAFPQRLGKPVVMLGQSVGPINGKLALRATRRALIGCTALVVREEKTARLLEDLGLRVKVAPDMAFLIEPSRPNGELDILEALSANEWLGVTVVNWSFPSSTDKSAARAAYKRALLETAEEAQRKWGLGTVFFPQVVVKHHGESDVELVEELCDELENRGVRVTHTNEDLSPAELSYLYGRCAVLVGTRLHSCILAACSNTPVIAIRYQGYKTEGVMAGLGLNGFVHDINSVDSSRLLKSLEDALSSRRTLSKQIEFRVSNHRRKLGETLAALIEQTNGGSRR